MYPGIAYSSLDSILKSIDLDTKTESNRIMNSRRLKIK